MKQWLNTPVTYGCMLRILLLCVITILVFVSALIAVFNLGGSHWNSVSATIFTVVGIGIGLGQWLIPLPTDKSEVTATAMPASVSAMSFEQALQLLYQQEEDRLKAASTQDLGTLIVSTGKENRGVTIYLLPRKEFLDSKSSDKRDTNKQKKTGTITSLRSGSHLLFVAYFRDLTPGRYNAWVGYGVEHPKSFIVQINKGSVSELQLDWKI